MLSPTMTGLLLQFAKQILILTILTFKVSKIIGIISDSNVEIVIVEAF